ncbi:MAG: 2OG-Fe dioxygenase family protein [Glaciimonas sp.]|nr:2OG-Fe dioxygenase family protein [Glaciimonas sp.]
MLVRRFSSINDEYVKNTVFLHIFKHNAPDIHEYYDRIKKRDLNISVHFVHYRTIRGGASFSSPVWLHVDDEPLVFIHLIQLTENAIDVDSVISGMDSKPTKYYAYPTPLTRLLWAKPRSMRLLL